MLEIVDLKIEDVDEVFNLENKLLGGCAKQSLIDSILSKTLFYKILKDGENIIGFYEVSIIKPEAELFDICVDEKFQGKGFASFMMKDLIDFSKKAGCDTIFLDVNIINNKAINLYKKFGFDEYAIRKKYYGENDAVLMKLCLN